MKKVILKNWIKLVIGIELVVLLITLAKCFLPLNTYDFSYEQMTVQNGFIVPGEGLLIEDNEEISTYFASVSCHNMRKGIYEVVVEYDTDHEGNYLEIFNSTREYRSLWRDDFKFSPDQHLATFRLWENQKAPAMYINVIYEGYGFLLLKNILVKECFEGRLYQLLTTIFRLIMLDLVLFIIVKAGKGEMNQKKVMQTGFLIGIIIFSSVPLLNSFLTEGDDIFYHLLRIEGLKDGLLSGQFPVRIHPFQLNGYGYANSIFYGELFLYIPAILRLLGVPLQTAYQIFLLMINCATALLSYWCMKKMLRNDGIALLCSMVYTLAPYRLTNMYVRSAVGEVCAMIFWPLIVLGLYQLYAKDPWDEDYKKTWIWLTIGYTGVIETHLLSCEIAAVFSVILSIICIKRVLRKETLVQLFKFVITTIALNAFFLVPLLYYMARGGILVLDAGALQTERIQGNGIYPAQLFNLFVNGHGMGYGHAVYDYRILGMYEEMGITVGIALLIPLVLFVYGIIAHWDRMRKEKEFYLEVSMAIAGGLSLYMATCLFPWDILCRKFGKIVFNLQFPWRILTVATIFLTVLFGAMCFTAKHLWGERVMYGLIGVVMFCCVVTTGYFMYDRMNTSKALNTYDATALLNRGTGSLDEYLLSETDIEMLDVTKPIGTENILIHSFVKEYTNIYLNVQEKTGKNEGFVTVPLLAYDGYEATDFAGESLSLTKNENGVLVVKVPAGYQGNLEIHYEGLWFWHLAEAITVLTVLFLAGLFLYKKKNSLRNDKFDTKDLV